MMKAELREEDPNVNMALRSGATIGEDKGKKPEEDTWVRKAPTKQPEFDLERVKETFMEAKKTSRRLLLQVARMKLSRKWILLC